MQKRRRIFVGNKATLLSVILIVVMSFFARLYMPVRSTGEPGHAITYLDHGYTYAETIKSSPFKFVRGREGSEEGFTVLLMRKDKKDKIPEEVYIYIGHKEYLKYILTIDTN